MPVWAHTTQASALLPLCADCLCSKCWRFMAELTCPTLAHNKHPTPIQLHSVYRFNKTTHTQPFNRTTQVGRYQKKTFTHSHPSWSSDILYQLPPSTTIHSILFVQFTCLTDLFHNLFPGLFGLRLHTPCISSPNHHQQNKLPGYFQTISENTSIKFQNFHVVLACCLLYNKQCTSNVEDEQCSWWNMWITFSW